MVKFRKIIYWLFYIAVFLIAVGVIVPLLPIPGNYKLLIVESGSMEPAIKTGSVVVVKPADSYKIGEVITFSDSGKNRTITHRIADIEMVSGKTYYITKGDANNAEDSNKVPEGKVVGRVLTSIPYAGYLLAAAKKPIGFVLLVIVPCAVIIFEELGKIWKEMKKKKTEIGN